MAVRIGKLEVGKQLPNGRADSCVIHLSHLNSNYRLAPSPPFDFDAGCLTLGESRLAYSIEGEVGDNFNPLADALSHRTARGVVQVCTLRGVALIVRAAPQRVVHMDPFDHQDFVLDVDLATSFGDKAAFAGIDPARFQRAPKCSAESTGRRCYNVIKGCGVIRILAHCGAVVFAYFVVGAEDNRLCLTWKGGLPNRSALAHDAHPGYVSRFLLNH